MATPICPKEAEWLQLQLAKKHREKEEKRAKKAEKQMKNAPQLQEEEPDYVPAPTKKDKDKGKTDEDDDWICTYCRVLQTQAGNPEIRCASCKAIWQKKQGITVLPNTSLDHPTAPSWQDFAYYGSGYTSPTSPVAQAAPAQPTWDPQTLAYYQQQQQYAAYYAQQQQQQYAAYYAQPTAPPPVPPRPVQTQPTPASISPAHISPAPAASTTSPFASSSFGGFFPSPTKTTAPATQHTAPPAHADEDDEEGYQLAPDEHDEEQRHTSSLAAAPTINTASASALASADSLSPSEPSHHEDLFGKRAHSVPGPS